MCDKLTQLADISIHALREEGDEQLLQHPAGSHHFYPRPPRGGRLDTKEAYKQILEFLSTPSARRATCWMPSGVCFRKFLSTPSARRATHRRGLRPQLVMISIHALREEGDVATLLRIAKAQNISIHALREEGDASIINGNGLF